MEIIECNVITWAFDENAQFDIHYSDKYKDISKLRTIMTKKDNIDINLENKNIFAFNNI